MSTVARGSRGVRILGVVLAVLNVLLWFCVPAIRAAVDTLLDRQQALDNPRFVNGVPELLVYFDPWLARGLFPAIYTLGFVAIAFLFKVAADPAGIRSNSVGSIVVAILLLGFEAVWLFLTVFAILFRGPNWNFFWPWEEWDPHKVVPLNWVNTSDVFWLGRMGWGIETMPWFVREAPGLILAAGYLVLGILSALSLYRGRGQAMTYWCFILLVLVVLTVFWPPLVLPPVIGLIAVGSYLLYFLVFRQLKAWDRSPMLDRPMAFWRCLLLVMLVQVAALVPVKMLLNWIFNVKYVIFVPEHFLNL